MTKSTTKAGDRKRGMPKTKQKIEVCDNTTPLDFLLMTMLNPKVRLAVRLDAAKSAAPFVHPQVAPPGVDVMRLLGRPLNES
jgi:hypothetical protein